MAAISYPSPITPRPVERGERGGRGERHLRLIPGGGGVRHHPAPAVYARRRLVAVVVAAVVVLALFASVQALASAAGLVARPAPATSVAPAPAAGAGTVHVVQPGDTVWSIARAESPDGDVRATVDRIVARNGGPVLQVGQRLVLD